MPDLTPLAENLILKKQEEVSNVKILFVGRFGWIKGLDILLEAVQKLRNKTINFEITIVSNCKSKPRVDIPKLPWICWINECDHATVMQLFQQAHIYIAPSRKESYGLTYLEGLANGCVVFTRNAEPQREFVDYGKAGIVMDHTSSDDIAQKLIEMIKNSEKRSEFALNGMRLFKQKWGCDVVEKKWREAIHCCLS